MWLIHIDPAGCVSVGEQVAQNPFLVATKLSGCAVHSFNHIIHSPAHAAVVGVCVQHQWVKPISCRFAEKDCFCTWYLDITVIVEDVDFHLLIHVGDELPDPVRLACSGGSCNTDVMIRHCIRTPINRKFHLVLGVFPKVVAQLDCCHRAPLLIICIFWNFKILPVVAEHFLGFKIGFRLVKISSKALSFRCMKRFSSRLE